MYIFTRLLTAVLVLLPLAAWNQVSEGFESTTPPATGWTYNSVTHGSNNPRAGTRCATFNGSGDYIITPLQAAPSALSFWYRRSGTSPTSPTFTVAYASSTSGPWTTIPTSSPYGASPANPITAFTTTYQQFTATLTGLSNVYIRIIDGRSAGANELYLDDFSITASSCTAPTLGASAVSGISTTGATLNGNITSLGTGGATSATVRGFHYSTNSGLASPTTVNNTGTFGTGAYNQTASGLTPNTLYYFRAYATNNCGTPQTGYSHTSGYPTFTTLHNAPTVGTGSAPTSSSFTASWSAPTGGGLATFTYEIQVDDDPAFGSVDYTQTGMASGTLGTNATGLASGTPYYYRVRAVNAGGNSAWSATSVGIATLAPSPEINLLGNGASIADGDATPSATDHTDFGNVALAGSFTRSFTIQNTGTASLNLTGTPRVALSGSADFSISTQPSAANITGSGSLTFVVTFTPNTVGSQTATVSISNDDSDENPYTFTVSATGTPSAASDLVPNATYSYNSNVDYTAYQVAIITNTAHSVDLFKFDLRDGGATADADNLPTILSAVTFTVSNASMIRTAALFNGNTLVNNAPAINTGSNTLAFSGLSGTDVTATDGGSNALTLRVTFNSTVTDNAQFQVSIGNANVTAAGGNTSSLFAPFTGISSSTTGDRNRIEVTADRLAFVQQPTSTAVGVAMSPAVSVAAVDTNHNRDLDIVSGISIASTGTLAGTSVSSAASAGLATFNTLTHTAGGTGFTLSATASGLTGATSAPFDINTVATGSYRTTGNGTWPSGTATWERFASGAWSSSAAPAANTANMLYIRHTVTTAAAFAAAAPGTNMTIESGGTFNAGHNCTYAEITVKSGGTFHVTTPGVTLNAAGTITAESGGRIILNSATLDNTDGFWDGMEDFQAGSTVELQNWDWDNSSGGAYRLVGNPSQISSNADGYLFGNLYFNAAPSENFTFIYSIPSPGTALKLAQNDLRVNTSVSAVQLVNTDQDVEIGGSVVVTGGEFRLAAVTSVEVSHTVKGNLEMTAGTLNLNPTSSTTNACIVNLEGDLVLSGGTFTSADLTATGLNFSGSDIQHIDVVNSVAMSGIKMAVLGGASVQLIDQNLLIGNNCGITVKSGGTFNFYFGVSGTPLMVSEISSGNSTTFTLDDGGTLKITSDETTGALRGTGNIGGNLRTDLRDLYAGGMYHYIGRANQVTGDGLPNNITGKVIVELGDSGLTLTPNTSRTFAAGGELRIKNGTLVENAGGAFFDGTGNLGMSGGRYQIATVNTGSIQLPRLSGTYALTGGTVELGGSTSSPSLIQMLRGAGREYHNLKISGNSSGGGYKTIASTVVVKNRLEITGSAIFDIGNKSLTGEAGITMDNGRLRMSKLNTALPELTGTATPYALTGGTVEFYGSGSSQSQLIRANYGPSTPIQYHDVDLNANAANADSYNVSPSSSLVVEGTLTVKSPAVFQLDETESVSGTGNVTLTAGSTLKYASPNGIKTSGTGTADGNIRISGTRTFPTTASYGFTGNGNMVSGNGLPATVANLYVQKGTTADQVSLSNSVSITDTLLMQSGHVVTGSHLLELGVSTAQKGSLHYTDGFVIGSMKRWFDGTNSGDASGLFPLGVNDRVRFVTVEYGSAPTTGGTLTAQFVGTTMGTNGLPLPIASAGSCDAFVAENTQEGYWQMDNSTLMGGTYDITLVGEDVAVSTDLCQLTAVKRVGAGPWMQSGTHVETTGSIARPVVKRTGASGWSNWGLSGGGVNPLPVELVSFTGICNDHAVALQWATASELNSERFIVEKSADLQTFEYVSAIPAAGMSNEMRNYEVSVPRLDALTYFRLRQEDFDGAFEYFGPISVSCADTHTWNLYTHGSLLFVSGNDVEPGTHTLRVVDMGGKQLHTQPIATDGTVNTHIDLSGLAPGIYLVAWQTAQEVKTWKIVVSR